KCRDCINVSRDREVANRAIGLCTCGRKPQPGRLLCVSCNDRLKNNDLDMRLAVIDYYSDGTMACRHCNETIWQFLTLDHVDGGGAKHRKEVGSIYHWLRRNNYPPGFRILCMNCNSGRAVNGGPCPHESQITPTIVGVI